MRRLGRSSAAHRLAASRNHPWVSLVNDTVPECPVLRITGNSPDSITESPHLEHPGGPLEVQQWEWGSPDADGVQALSRRSPGPCSHGETTWRSTHYVSGGGLW